MRATERRARGVGRRLLLRGGAWIGLAAVFGGCRANSLRSYRDRLRAVAIAATIRHEAVIYVAGQPMLVDPLAGPAQQNQQIAAGVAALNLQERARALCPARRFAQVLADAAQASLPTIGLAAAGPGAPTDATLELRIDKFGIRAALEDAPARYSVEARARLVLTGEGRVIWSDSLEIADALGALGAATPTTVAEIARVEDPAVAALMEAIARAGGEGVIAALGRALGPSR